MGGGISDKCLNQRLGNGTVHAIHAHVVTVVGGPTQGQLGQIARAHDQSTDLIAQVHKDLRTFARLTVLVGYIVHVDVVTDILKVLGNALGNGNFTDTDAKALHKVHGIVISAVGSAESGIVTP